MAKLKIKQHYDIFSVNDVLGSELTETLNELIADYFGPINNGVMIWFDTVLEHISESEENVVAATKILSKLRKANMDMSIPVYYEW